LSFAELDPRLFSFNSRHGACPTCNGMGTTNDFDVDLLMPDARLSLRQGALALYQGGPFKARHRERLFHDAAEILGIDLDQPLAIYVSASTRPFGTASVDAPALLRGSCRTADA